MVNVVKISTLVEKVLKMYKNKNNINKMSYEDISNAIFENEEIEGLILSAFDKNVSEEVLNSIDNSSVRTAIDMVLDKNKVEVIDDFKIPESNNDIDISKASGLDLYLKDMAYYPLLTPEEEVTLFKRLEAGDLSARGEIAARNQRLVISIAKHYHFENSDDLLCLIQDGNLGLMKAIDKFEVDKGYKFSTYATWWIRQSISREKDNNQGTIRMPVYLITLLKKMRAYLADCYETKQYKPSEKEIAEYLGVKEDVVRKLMVAPTDLVSLNAKVNCEEEETEIGDLVVNDENNIEEEALNNVTAKFVSDVALSALNPREAQILVERFGLNGSECKTLEEVGNEFGITKERVRQIEAKAIRKLRHPSVTKKLRGCL